MKEVKLPKMKNFQKSVLIGTVLGDASIVETKNRRRQVKWEQKEESKEYVDHIHQIFQPWINKTEPTLRKIPASVDKNGRKWKERSSYYSRTRTHSIWDFYAKQFYKRGENGRRKTVVPKLIHRWLNSVSLAYWYMDDGSFTPCGVDSKAVAKNIRLNTQGFSLTENRLLQQALGRCFGFKVSIHKDNRRKGTLYFLYICAESREDFFRVVSPYMHPIFEYKLPEKCVFIGPRIREWYGICK